MDLCGASSGLLFESFRFTFANGLRTQQPLFHGGCFENAIRNTNEQPDADPGTRNTHRVTERDTSLATVRSSRLIFVLCFSEPPTYSPAGTPESYPDTFLRLPCLLDADTRETRNDRREPIFPYLNTICHCHRVFLHVRLRKKKKRREDKIKQLSQANRRLQHRNDHLRERNDHLRETEKRLSETKLVVSSLRSKVKVLYEKEDSHLAQMQDGYRREHNLGDQLGTSKKRVAMLLAKVRAAKQKVREVEQKVTETEEELRESEERVRESEERVRESEQNLKESEDKVKRAVSMLLAKQTGNSKKKSRMNPDTENWLMAQMQGGARKKARKNTSSASTESVAQGGGAIARGGEGGGGGRGSGSGPSRCERCLKKGFTCNHIVLRKNAPSCMECRSKRMGCSFNRP